MGGWLVYTQLLLFFFLADPDAVSAKVHLYSFCVAPAVCLVLVSFFFARLMRIDVESGNYRQAHTK